MFWFGLIGAAVAEAIFYAPELRVFYAAIYYCCLMVAVVELPYVDYIYEDSDGTCY